MTDKKQCSKCKVFQLLEKFNEGRKQCNVCLENKLRYREAHKEQIQQKSKEYYENNKEQIADKNKTYRENNKDAILEKKKNYRENHKDEIKQKAKDYREKNKEDINEKQKDYKQLKVECPLCKCFVGKYRMKKHQQTSKHQLRVKGRENNNDTVREYIETTSDFEQE